MITETPIGADWKAGDRLFLDKGWHYATEAHQGYIVTLTTATKARVKVGDLTWRRDGYPYGGGYGQGRLRPLRDGDEALDAAWRQRVKAERDAQRRLDRADRLKWLSCHDWRRLPADQVETIHGWLAAVGVKA